MKKWITKSSEKKVKELYQQSYSKLFTQGFMLCGQKNLVKDCIQNLFLELCEKPQLIDGMMDPQAYLFIALRRKIISELKKVKENLNPDEYAHLFMSPSYEKLLIQMNDNQLLKDKMKQILETLSPTEKKVMNMRFFEGKSYKEIATLSNTTERTVYNQIHSAIKKIRNQGGLTGDLQHHVA